MRAINPEKPDKYQITPINSISQVSGGLRIWVILREDLDIIANVLRTVGMNPQIYEGKDLSDEARRLLGYLEDDPYSINQDFSEPYLEAVLSLRDVFFLPKRTGSEGRLGYVRSQMEVQLHYLAEAVSLELFSILCEIAKENQCVEEGYYDHLAKFFFSLESNNLLVENGTVENAKKNLGLECRELSFLYMFHEQMKSFFVKNKEILSAKQSVGLFSKELLDLIELVAKNENYVWVSCTIAQPSDVE